MDLPVTSAPGSQRIQPLDGLRAVLALAITAYHLGAPYVEGAVVALPVFYALSGTLITSLLLAERRRHGRIRLLRFVMNRFLRIAPPVVVLVIVVAATWPAVGGFNDSNDDLGVAVTLALTWTTNVGRAFFGIRQGALDPLWSLSAEEQFYVLWPALFTALVGVARGRRALTGILLVFMVVGPAVCAPFFAPSPDAGPAAVYYAPPISMSSLASGCLGALVLDEFRRTGRWTARRAHLTTWTSFLVLVGIAACFTPAWKSDPFLVIVALPAAGAAAACFIAGLGTSDTVPSRILGVRPLAWYGARASYSLYIWHLVVLAVAEPFIDGVAGRAVILVVAVMVGGALGIAVEQPADRFRRWVLRRPAGPERRAATAAE
jgi:peptidoglycan/LPS O-acetylase OafA/YrhL